VAVREGEQHPDRLDPDEGDNKCQGLTLRVQLIRYPLHLKFCKL